MMFMDGRHVPTVMNRIDPLSRSSSVHQNPDSIGKSKGDEKPISESGPLSNRWGTTDDKEDKDICIDTSEGHVDSTPKKPNPPLFPHLAHLDLSHNKICEEEDVLAVAAWPMLAELILHDNPLSTQRVGDLPLLKKYLTSRLGIRVQRKRCMPLQRPTVEIDVRSERKVKTQVPKVPKKDVEAIIAAIEAPIKNALSSDSTKTPAIQACQTMDGHTPLPPITSKLPPKENSGDEIQIQRDEQQSNAFFMTQVYEVERQSPPLIAKEIEQTDRYLEQTVDDLEEYDRFEEILKIEELEGKDKTPIPKDVEGNVRALKYALQHPLVFRDNQVNLNEQQQPYKSFTLSMPREAVAKKSKSLRTDQLLDKVKNSTSLNEVQLAVLLKDRRQPREFNEAQQLLSSIQNKYNAVCAASMTDVDKVQLEAKTILNETLKYKNTQM